MARRSKPLIPQKDGFCVSGCSLCEKITLCVGNTALGGIRWCRDCIKLSLGWFQMTDEEKATVEAGFTAMAANPRVIRQLQEAAKLTDEDAKNLSIGESRRRLMDAAFRDQS